MRDEYSDDMEARSKRQEAWEAALREFPIELIGTLEIREPQWLVEGFLEEASMGMIFGESGAGKSFLALDIGLSVAAGINWHTHSVSQGPVIYICGEGRNGVIRRVGAWAKDRGVDRKKIPFLTTAGPVHLNAPSRMTTIRNAINAIAAKVGKPKLILLDTWAANLGGDENSTSDSMAGVTAFQQLCSDHGSAGLIVHHVGHGDKSRARGSSALKAAVDMEYLVEQDKDKTIRVTNTKAKDSERSTPMAFVLKSIELGTFDKEGKPYTSGVIQPTNYSPAKATIKTPSGKLQKKCLAILDTLIAEAYEQSEDDDISPSEIGIQQNVWRDAVIKAKVERTRIYEVEQSLSMAGQILIEDGLVFRT
ncbi:MAG: AAA family ATPase [Spirochaetales bacterium]